MLEVTGSIPVSPTISLFDIVIKTLISSEGLIQGERLLRLGSRTAMSIQIHLRDLKEHEIVLNLDHSPVFFELKDNEFRFDDRVVGEVTFKLIGKNVISTGWIETRARATCVRCLEEMEITLHTDVDITYSNDKKLLEPSSEFDPTVEILTFFEGDIIDPRKELRELVMLELPFLPVCHPDCRGLCSGCGVNLNKDQCTCQRPENEDTSMPAWKKTLRRLHPEDKT